MNKLIKLAFEEKDAKGLEKLYNNTYITTDKSHVVMFSNGEYLILERGDNGYKYSKSANTLEEAEKFINEVKLTNGRRMEVKE